MLKEGVLVFLCLFMASCNAWATGPANQCVFTPVPGNRNDYVLQIKHFCAGCNDEAAAIAFSVNRNVYCYGTGARQNENCLLTGTNTVFVADINGFPSTVGGTAASPICRGTGSVRTWRCGNVPKAPPFNAVASRTYCNEEGYDRYNPTNPTTPCCVPGPFLANGHYDYQRGTACTALTWTWTRPISHCP